MAVMLEWLDGALGTVPEAFLVPLLTSLFLCLLVMWTLRESAGLPLVISVFIVPVVVGVGFGLAVGIHILVDLPMLLVGGGLATTLFPLAYAYEKRFGSPA